MVTGAFELVPKTFARKLKKKKKKKKKEIVMRNQTKQY